MVRQEQLFSDRHAHPESVWPEGFRYQPELIDRRAETRLAELLQTLELKPFEFHGHLANRRVVSFGIRYKDDRREVQISEEIPAFLVELRKKAAMFASLAPEDIQQVGVNEYKPGAGIGWHRDKPQFGDVIGISILAPATMRLRKRHGQKWLRRSIVLQPRSIYVLSGEVRRRWEHSIPPVGELRYSITFRTLATETHQGFREGIGSAENLESPDGRTDER